MTDRADTGAREPQPNAEALALRVRIALDYGLQVWRTTPTRVHFQTASDALNELLALAAGVGVGVPPPENQDLVSAPAKERQDARAAQIAACPEPFWHETHRYCPVCPWTENDERSGSG